MSTFIGKAWHQILVLHGSLMWLFLSQHGSTLGLSQKRAMLDWSWLYSRPEISFPMSGWPSWKLGCSAWGKWSGLALVCLLLQTCVSRESFPLKDTLNVTLNLGQMMQGEVERCLKPKEGQRHISNSSKVIFGRVEGADIRQWWMIGVWSLMSHRFGCDSWYWAGHLTSLNELSFPIKMMEKFQRLFRNLLSELSESS